jgi:soluble calcium-activated nucleotidase 1
MTVQYDKLLVGSIGKEWINEKGETVHNDTLWVKSIDKYGNIESLDWTKNYQEIRSKTGHTYPGYLIHEAIIWDEFNSKFIIVPRKASTEGYEEKKDEKKGTNLMIISNQRFNAIKVKKLGEEELEYGFSSIKKLPNMNMFVGIKVKELTDPKETNTKLIIFDTEGKFHSDYVDLGNIKFEGIEIFSFNLK